MQHSGAFRAPTNAHSSYRLAYTASPAPTTPIRGATPLGNVNRYARDHTLELDTDENAPPDPSKEPGDDLPPPAGARMIGAFDAASTAANTPRTLVARLSPARTLSGSVAGTAPGNTPPTRKNRIAFRGDPNMVTAFDKKVDGELYELWTSK